MGTHLPDVMALKVGGMSPFGMAFDLPPIPNSGTFKAGGMSTAMSADSA